MKTVIIAGGGASGMLAALTAAESGKYRVLLFERQARVGRKLLSTGNGRCNLTNLSASPEYYHGMQPDFISPALSAFSPAAAIEYFRSLGLVCVSEPSGRVYPLSDSAGSVLDVLRFALESTGVEIHTAEPVLRASAGSGGGFTVFTENGRYSSDFLVIACGGCAGGKLGGVSDGYELLKAFGHGRTKLYPSLVPVYTDSDYPRSLKGIRTDAALSLEKNSCVIAESFGEVQFVEKGISGPAVFEISRAVSVHGGTVTLDFLRSYSPDDVLSMLRRRRKLSPSLECTALFAGILHSRLGLAVVKYAGIRPSALIGTVSETDLLSLSQAAKAFTMNTVGTDSFDAAQVTAGGVSTAEFRPDTLESRLVKGLFACGEVLDIDGDCGGFNLQWAWSSGRTAGRLGQ